MCDKQWASMQDLPSYWPDSDKEDGKQGRRNGSKSQWLSFSSRLWLIVTQRVYMWNEVVQWEEECVSDQFQMSVSVQANIPHTAKTNQIQLPTFTGTSQSQSLLHHPCSSPSRSADVQTECANVLRKTARKQLDKNTIDKEEPVPETSQSPIHCKKVFTWNLVS